MVRVSLEADQVNTSDLLSRVREIYNKNGYYV